MKGYQVQRVTLPYRTPSPPKKNPILTVNIQFTPLTEGCDNVRCNIFMTILFHPKNNPSPQHAVFSTYPTLVLRMPAWVCVCVSATVLLPFGGALSGQSAPKPGGEQRESG